MNKRDKEKERVARARDLSANPHLILAYTRAAAPWATVISEFVDNAFDGAAGNAREVRIDLKQGSLTVTDFGRGIEDINRLARLGDSATFFQFGNIGQYGVGSKAWMSKAAKLEVETVHAGRRHQHTFNLTPALRAFKKRQAPSWPVGYSGNGKAVEKGAATFTRLTLKDLHTHAGPISTSHLVRELQRNYWPGLLDGRRIVITDFRRRLQAVTVVEPLKPPDWTDRLTFESSVNGRKYKATVGILSESIGSHSGLFLGFLFRTISVEKALPDRPFSPRVHGQVWLSEEWYDALSPDKTGVIKDKDPLLLDIGKHAARIFKDADEYTEDLRLENVSLQLQAVAAKAIRKSGAELRLVNSKHSAEGEPRQRDPDAEIVERTKRDAKATLEKAPAENTAKDDTGTASGLKVRWQRLGNDTLGDVGVDDRIVIVTLNRDCPKLEAQSRQPRYPGLFLAIGNELSLFCLDLKPPEIQDLFGPMLGSAFGSESQVEMIRAIRVWWAFIAEESSGEDERASG